MNGINKIQASILYGNGYKLQDKEGIVWSIRSAFELQVTKASFLEITTSVVIKCIDGAQIGTDYFIIARPLTDLTKPIMYEGKEFVPIEEIAKKHIDWQEADFNLKVKCHFSRQMHVNIEWQHPSQKEPFRDDSLFVMTVRLHLNKTFVTTLLYQWHFAVIEGVPQEYYIKI